MVTTKWTIHEMKEERLVGSSSSYIRQHTRFGPYSNIAGAALQRVSLRREQLTNQPTSNKEPMGSRSTATRAGKRRNHSHALKRKKKVRVTMCHVYLYGLVIVLVWHHLKVSFTTEGEGDDPSSLLSRDRLLLETSPKSGKESLLHKFVEQPTRNVSFVLDSTASLPWAIFYNIFIPLGQGVDKRENVKRIVKEQVDFVRRSSSIPEQSNKTATLFYNTIGEEGVVDEEFIQRLCTEHTPVKPGRKPRAPIKCVKVKHYKSAFEEVTLQNLFDFCRANPPSFRATYIHSKGSYHDHDDRRNEFWRQHGTLAVLHSKCVNPPEKRCNVCGLQFWAQWTPFMPGNFFTASCSYVKNLRPPNEFAEEMNNLTKKALYMRLQGLFQTNLFTGRQDHFGIGRYSAEHWIGSHPDLRPCDLSEHGDFGKWISQFHGSKMFSFGMGPRHEGSPVGEEHKTLSLVMSNSTLRTQEYFLLAGRLFKYFELYEKAPPSNSWVWRFFADGEKWKKAVSLHGKEAVSVMIRRAMGLATPNHLSPYLVSNALVSVTNDNSAKPQTNSSLRSSHWAVFYQIDLGLPQESGDIRVLIQEQLRVISKSYASSVVSKLVVHYTTVGQLETANALNVDMACSQFPNIACINLGHVEVQGDQAALTKIHEFCSSQVTGRVVYVGTGGGYEDHSSFASAKQERLLATRAVTSKDCLELTEFSCNICGIDFYTQWGFMMRENMWSANCTYIRKLPHPQIFGEQWKASTQELLLMQRYDLFSSNIFSELPEVMGVDEHALKQWAGSHPSIRPCVARTDNKGGLSKAPMGHSAPRHWNATLQDDLMYSDYERVREIVFLGGRLLRWLFIYNETPPEDSFVWDWFPDGKPWKAAAQKGVRTIRSVLSDPTSLMSMDNTIFARFDKKVSPGWVLFYNIFIPSDLKGQMKTVEIIEEQLNQVAQSFAASKQGLPLTLFISTIGASRTSIFKKITHFCSRSQSIQCIHMGHHANGHENVTLQHIHDFCSISEHEELRFAYIHSKGSFHPSSANDRWRRHSTMAVTSKGCLQPPDDRCNICGLQFYPVWNIFFPGTFFAAQCSYIKKLISPKYFGERLLRMATGLRKYRKEGRLFAYNLYDHGLPWRNGVDRYAWEIWAGTHPSIVPCDLSVSPDHSFWREQGNRGPDELVWSMAPRQKSLNDSWFLLESRRRDMVMGSRDLRMRDYFLLPGNIAKWALLYEEEGNPFESVKGDSWIWSWFPDGEEWKEAVSQHGDNAFEVVTNQFLRQKSNIGSLLEYVLKG